MPSEIDTSKMSAEEIAELQKQNCIFCKIAKKEIPAKIIHEDSKVMCILDINPASEGHILVLPKEHYMILPHIPEDVLTHLFKSVQLMSHTLLKTLQCKGTSVFIANGAAAGQKAPHVLIHVFPRKEKDGLLELPKYEMSEEQVQKLKITLKPYFSKIFGPGKHIEDDSRSIEKGNDASSKMDSDNEISTVDDVFEKKLEPDKKIDSEKKSSLNVDESQGSSQDFVDEGEESLISNHEKKSSSKSKSVKKFLKNIEKSEENSTPESIPKPVKKVNLDDISRLFG